MTLRPLAQSRLPVVATGVLAALRSPCTSSPGSDRPHRLSATRGSASSRSLLASVESDFTGRSAPAIFGGWRLPSAFTSPATRSCSCTTPCSNQHAVSVDRRLRVPGWVRLGRRLDDLAHTPSRATCLERRARQRDRPGRVGTALLVHARGARCTRCGIDDVEQDRLLRLPVRNVLLVVAVSIVLSTGTRSMSFRLIAVGRSSCSEPTSSTVSNLRARTPPAAGWTAGG